ncbi:hypothetical protein AP6_007 [Salmonella phage TS6]|uniref:Uncharacterized protein n=1 Tax=Salmonella phage TS6 TaxID=2491323 RepID=A0A5S9BG11_9CAUD|nr:hypothetical protein [Salmonella enterica]YP_010582240.1 hypothetical protein PF620_gp07 [Salmonella phage TS6]AZF89050.1 hypothetical protein AP6_007 [Salmonella phage TS6]
MAQYEIPDCNDPEWQSQMLRELEENLQLLRDDIGDDNPNLVDSLSIVDALRQYSGY